MITVRVIHNLTTIITLTLNPNNNPTSQIVDNLPSCSDKWHDPFLTIIIIIDARMKVTALESPTCPCVVYR